MILHKADVRTFLKTKKWCQAEFVEADLGCTFYEICFDRLNMAKFLEKPLRKASVAFSCFA